MGPICSAQWDFRWDIWPKLWKLVDFFKFCYTFFIFKLFFIKVKYNWHFFPICQLFQPGHQPHVIISRVDPNLPRVNPSRRGIEGEWINVTLYMWHFRVCVCAINQQHFPTFPPAKYGLWTTCHRQGCRMLAGFKLSPWLKGGIKMSNDWTFWKGSANVFGIYALKWIFLARRASIMAWISD